MSKEKKIDDSELSEVSGAGDPIIDLDAGNLGGGGVDDSGGSGGGGDSGGDDTSGGTTGGGDSRGGGGGHGGRLDRRKDFADPS